MGESRSLGLGLLGRTATPGEARRGTEPAGRAPVVTGCEPLSARVGERLTIHGVGFGSENGNVVVTVNGAPARVISTTDREITVVMPAGTGAAAQIVVQVDGRVSELREVPGTSP